MTRVVSPSPGPPAQASPARPIYCIGDSHVCFFSGQDTIQPGWPDRSKDLLPGFVTHHIGAALAYNLTRLGTQTKGRERLFEVLERVPRGATVLLCFGEIDCRAHVIKQAAQRGLPVETIVGECLEHYFQVVREVKALGFPVIVYNAVPSAITKVGKSRRQDEYAAVGSVQERNRAIRAFNAGARERCESYGLKFLEIFPDLVNERGEPVTWYYFDAIHLSQRALPFALRALARLYPQGNFPQLPILTPAPHERVMDRVAKRVRRWLKRPPPRRATKL